MSQMKVPCWRGSLIGHIPEQCKQNKIKQNKIKSNTKTKYKNIVTLPIGGHVQIDADAGSITMLEAAVS